MTLSITGLCPRTGQLGLAMSSHDVNFAPAFSDALQLRPHSQVVARTGAIAAQANTRPGFAAEVMDLMWQGIAAPDALKRALAEEERDTRERSQIGVVDAGGRGAAFTGELTFNWCGHLAGDGWVAAGNILAGKHVVEAAGSSFEADAAFPLDERLVTALEAGIAAGGDRRGHRGAYLRVATGDSATELEIRIHSHPEPAAELRRLIAICRHERDFVTVAMEAATAIRASLSEAELQQFAGLSTCEAVGRIRDLLAARDAPPESLEVVDRILSILPEQATFAEQRFGDILTKLPI